MTQLMQMCAEEFEEVGPTTQIQKKGAFAKKQAKKNKVR